MFLASAPSPALLSVRILFSPLPLAMGATLPTKRAPTAGRALLAHNVRSLLDARHGSLLDGPLARELIFVRQGPRHDALILSLPHPRPRLGSLRAALQVRIRLGVPRSTRPPSSELMLAPREASPPAILPPFPFQAAVRRAWMWSRRLPASVRRARCDRQLHARTGSLARGGAQASASSGASAFCSPPIRPPAR